MDASLISESNFAAAVACPIVASIFLLLRIVCRLRYDQRLSPDDWICAVSVLMSWFLSINSIVAGAMAGIGTIKVSPLSASFTFVRALWIASIAMRLALGTVKLTVLAFYHRIFVTTSPRRMTWATIAAVVGWMVSTFVAQFLITTPLSKAWNPLLPDEDNYSYPAFGVAVASISLALDVITLLIPVYPVAKLQMPTKRKIAVICIFWLGGFCCVAGAIRLYYLNSSISATAASHSANRYDIVTHAYTWTHIEVNVSIIAACLPTLGPFFRTGTFERWWARSLSAVSLRSLRSMVRGRNQRSRGDRSGGKGESTNRNHANPSMNDYGDGIIKRTEVDVEMTECLGESHRAGRDRALFDGPSSSIALVS